VSGPSGTTRSAYAGQNSTPNSTRLSSAAFERQCPMQLCGRSSNIGEVSSSTGSPAFAAVGSRCDDGTAAAESADTRPQMKYANRLLERSTGGGGLSGVGVLRRDLS